jgi:hypothetical protein
MLDSRANKGGVNVRRFLTAAGIAGALIFTSACSSSVPSASDTSGPSGSASATATPSPVALLPGGLVAKGVANDGKGDYLQTSIADTDPAMRYNPAIADDAAKAHYSEAELAEAQKVIVRFIAEEAIDSTLNGGTDIDGWWAAHKDQIHPANQDGMLQDLKTTHGNSVVARELWMADKPGLSYVHGADTPRVTQRTITPSKLRFVEDSTLQGVMLDTTASYEMPVAVDGKRKKVQSTAANISFAVAKDAADGNKWKIAGYQTDFTTTEYIID